MKYLIFFLPFLLAFSWNFAARKAKVEKEQESPTKESSTAMRYRHIQLANGKILATIDTETKKIEYQEKPEQSVEALLAIIDSYSAECRKTVSELQAKLDKASHKK